MAPRSERADRYARRLMAFSVVFALALGACASLEARYIQAQRDCIARAKTKAESRKCREGLRDAFVEAELEPAAGDAGAE